MVLYYNDNHRNNELGHNFLLALFIHNHGQKTVFNKDIGKYSCTTAHDSLFTF